MWLSEKTAASGMEPERVAEIGKVTLEGSEPGILADCEVRTLSSLGPGGYYWNAEVGREAMLIRAADGTRVVAGDIHDRAPIEIEPGEVYIGIKDGTYMHVKNDGHILLFGNIDLVGQITINGMNA